MIRRGAATDAGAGPTGAGPAGGAHAAPPPGGHDRQRRRLLVAAGVMGLVATTWLALAGTSVGQHVAGEDLWYFEVAALDRDSLGGRPALVLCGSALTLLAAAWLVVGRALRHGATSRAVGALAGLWAVPLVVGIPLFSPDVYHYVAVGSSIQHGIDPYAEGPGAAGDIPGTRGAEGFWMDSPSPYSPPFVALLDGLAAMFDEDVRAVVVALRVLAVLAWVGIAVVVLRIADRCGLDGARSLWLVFANPLMLLHAVSGVHNDVLMLVFVLTGAWAALAGRPYLAVVLCGMGAGVKVMALAVVGVVAVEAACRQHTRAARLRTLAGVAATGAGVFVLAVTVTGYSWTWVRNLSVPGKANEPLSPPTALAVLIDSDDPPLAVVRAAALVVGAVVCLVLLTRVPRWGLLRVTAWILATVVVTGSVVWPWYLLWPLAFLALTGVREERWLVVAVSTVGVFLTLPGGRATLQLVGRPLADAAVLTVLVSVALAAAWWSARQRGLQGAPGEPDPTPVSHAGGPPVSEAR